MMKRDMRHIMMNHDKDDEDAVDYVVDSILVDDVMVIHIVMMARFENSKKEIRSNVGFCVIRISFFL